MKAMICATAPVALALLLAPSHASAADLYGYEVRGVVVDDDPPVVVERERIIERRYYAGRDEPPPPAAAYEERVYRPAYYPDRRYWRAYDEW